MMYDAIVIGARCAGASTALLLARKRHKVLLVDRSVIPQGHFIYRGGPQRLHKWGILDQIEASGCPLVTTAITSIAGVSLRGEALFEADIPFGCAPRRAVLDKILVDTAVVAGAELRDQCVVEEFLSDGDQITGVKGRDLRSGQRFREMAQIVIGADGRHSRLAQAVQAPVYEEVATVSCYYFSYWSGVPNKLLEVHNGKQQIIFAFPTNDNLMAVFIGRPIEQFQQIRADIEGHFRQALEQAPELAAQIRAGKREERFYGTADLPNFFRKPYGAGWALVGDAAHHKDPFLALGITDALRDAELVADAVHDGLSGKRPLLEALADYENQRNEQSRPLYYENLARARFSPPPPEFMQVRTALLQTQNQADINHFTQANLGVVSRESFFNPENMGRILKDTYHYVPPGDRRWYLILVNLFPNCCGRQRPSRKRQNDHRRRASCVINYAPMTNQLLLQILGLLALILGVVLGYWRWLRPYHNQLNNAQRSLLLLVILTFIGGLFGAFGWWLDVPASFSWDLPPLASRMLAAAGWSFALACWLALERPSLPRLRLIVIMLFVYLMPLTVAIVLFHLGRFDWTAPITYGFFGIVVPMVALTSWHLFHPLGIVEITGDGPVQGVAKWWLWGTAVITAMWGLALFMTDNGPSAFIWVWPGDLLTSRLIAVMLWTLAAAAVYSLRSREAMRVALATLVAYGVGVVAANVWKWTAVKPVYVIFFAILAVGSLIILVQTRSNLAGQISTRS